MPQKKSEDIDMRKCELTEEHLCAAHKIEDRIAKGKSLAMRSINSEEGYKQLQNDYKKWDSYNCDMLTMLFTTQHMEIEYRTSSAGVISLSERGLFNLISDLRDMIQRKITKLESISERLEMYKVVGSRFNKLGFNEEPTALSHQENGKNHQNVHPIHNKKVFIVHGHDGEAKLELHNLLQKLGLEPIILHQQPDKGRTIIEKFEQSSDVGFAFVLLTPDDIGYSAAEEVKAENLRSKEHRARQNVVFELGFFVGKLGRERVCCLYTGNVAIPSDISGVIYTRFQNSVNDAAWQIMNELKAANYTLKM